MVRAKFRVMELSQQWNGTLTAVRLLPVSAKSSWSNDPTDSVENAAFWEATPSGEAELYYKGFDDIPYEIGQCVFIDMEQLDAEPKEDESKNYWKLESVKSSSNLEVALRIGWREDKLSSGTIKMDIHNETAWPPFLGKHLTHWSVTITPTKG